MQRIVSIAVAGVAFLGVGMNATPARAQLATTTFVSGFGFDTNPCTVAAPCRSFQHAHDVTAAGGQITMLDPAGYGTVMITKAISIVNDGGGEAGITDTTPLDIAIIVNAGASDVVNLRGLTLNGVGVADNGIVFGRGAALNVQNCVIRDFAQDGVAVVPAASATMTIADTIISNNGDTGVSIHPGSGVAVTAHLERVAAIGNAGAGFGFLASGTGTIKGTIVDSAVTGNGVNSVNGGGIILQIAAGSDVTLINTKATRNKVGLAAINGTTYISGVTLAGNVVSGYFQSGGTLNTFGDNYIIDTTNSGTLTAIAAQ